MSTADNLAEHQIHREKIEALLKPLEEIEPAILRAITPHYQQRISEIRKRTGKRIVNVKRTRLVDGKVKAADGAYRWEPFDSLGRDASVPAADRWTIPEAPFGPELFRLT